MHILRPQPGRHGHRRERHQRRDRQRRTHPRGFPVRQRFGKCAIRNQGVHAAGQQQPALQRIQLQRFQRVHPRCQQQPAEQVNHHHHLQRIPHRQQLLLPQGIEGPDRGRQQHQQHTRRVVAQRGEQLNQTLVEKQSETNQQHQQANPLPHAEAFLEHKQAGDQQHDRAHLHHQLRRARAEQIQAHQVQDVVAHQTEHRHHHQPATARAEHFAARQASGRCQINEQAAAGHHQAKPGHRDRVHHQQHLLEFDRQDSPQKCSQQGQEQTINPAPR
ncbi:hypothetical protein D3C84_599890 [compost metagenome]